MRCFASVAFLTRRFSKRAHKIVVSFRRMLPSEPRTPRKTSASSVLVFDGRGDWAGRGFGAPFKRSVTGLYRGCFLRSGKQGLMVGLGEPAPVAEEHRFTSQMVLMVGFQDAC